MTGLSYANEINKDIKIEKKEAFYAKYCPDNTCEYVKSSLGNQNSTKDILYLYLFSTSQYIYLKSWKESKATTKLISTVLKKINYKECLSKFNLSEQSKCVLYKKIQLEEIELYFSREDEGFETNEKIEIEYINIDIISNEKQAIQFAELVFSNIYGDQVLSQRPFVATLKKNVWYVEGSFHCPKGNSCKGGVAEISFSKKDARVIKITHGK